MFSHLGEVLSQRVSSIQSLSMFASKAGAGQQKTSLAAATAHSRPGMHRLLAKTGRMIASRSLSSLHSRSVVSTGGLKAPARPQLPRSPHLPCQQQLLASARLLTVPRSMPEDLDAFLISRRALSSLDAPQTPQQTTSSSSSAGSEAESSVDWEDVQGHKRAAVQQAFINNSLAFGFSAGGLVFPYYVGLVSSLVQHGVLTRPSQLAGSSAGSLIAASFNSGLDMETVERSMIDFGEDCLKNGTRYRLGPLLRDFLNNYLPPDAHEQCSGTTHVAVTRLLPYWRTQMVSHFESREDLISALMTSCHIPWYFDGRWMTKFRDHYCVDGGVMAFIPTVQEADYTVKVMCFPSSHLSLIKGATAGRKTLKRIHSLVDIDITLDAFEDWPYDLQQVLKWALLASAQETSSLLIEKGKRDATAWFESMELGPLVAAQQAQQQTVDSSSAGRRLQAQLQAQGGVVLGSSSNSSSGAQRQGGEQQGSVVGDWADGKSHERQQEAEQAQQKTAAAEEMLQSDVAVADAAAGNGDGLPSRAAVKHAAEVDVAGVAEPPNKRHKAAAATATVAAAAGGAAEGVGSLLGKQKAGESQREE